MSHSKHELKRLVKRAKKTVRKHYRAGWRPTQKLRAQDMPATTKVASDNPARFLIRWYNNGAAGGIDWGEPGDWQQCVDIAGNYIDDPEGFCQLRHIDATGMTTSEHAHESRSA
jgi:hypothetical protein